MAAKLLVGPDLEGGIQLIEAVKRAGVRLTGAFWYKVPVCGWRLVLVTPMLKTLGFSALYKTLLDIIDAGSPAFTFKMFDVALESAENTAAHSVRVVARGVVNKSMSFYNYDGELQDAFVHFMK